MDEKLIQEKNVKLENILSARIPPFCWDLTGCLFGLFILFHNNHYWMILGGLFFISYKILNVIFDTFTFSCEYTNASFPKYDELGFYDWSIVNKKYNLKDGMVINDKFKNMNKNQPIGNLNNYLKNNFSVSDISNLKLDLCFYIGNNENVELLLYYIHLFGITKKNYTRIDVNKLKPSIDHFSYKSSTQKQESDDFF